MASKLWATNIIVKPILLVNYVDNIWAKIEKWVLIPDILNVIKKIEP